MKKIAKIVFEYEDGSMQRIEGEQALLFQARVNSSGILAGIPVVEEIKEEK